MAGLRIKPTKDLHSPESSFTPFLQSLMGLMGLHSPARSYIAFLRLLDVMGLDGLDNRWALGDLSLERLGLESSEHALGDLMLELLGLESGLKASNL
jgi:hypothetical protein